MGGVLFHSCSFSHLGGMRRICVEGSWCSSLRAAAVVEKGRRGGRGRLAPGGKIANRFRKTINTEIRLREAVKNYLSDFFR